MCKKFNTRKFAETLMGRKVLVKARLWREKNYATGVVKYSRRNLHEWRTGWVVGVRWLLEGKVIRNDQTYSDECGYSQEFKETRRFPVVLVSYWPTEKPVHVPMDGLLEMEPTPDPLDVIKFPYPSSGYGSGKTRREMIKLQREYTKGQAPRDEKGRFTEIRGGRFF